MTTPSGLSRRAIAFLGAARGAVAQRATTAEFYTALRAHATALQLDELGLTFHEVTQLRSAAARMRNAQDRFQAAPEANAIEANQIGRAPYGRSLDQQAAMPIYSVGITLQTMDNEGEVTTRYTQVRFTDNLPSTKGELLTAVQQDAEALADNYNEQYAGHAIVEVLAV